MFADVLREIGLSEEQVKISNMEANLKERIFKGDLNVCNLVPYSVLMRLKNILSTELKVDVELKIVYSCFATLIESDNREFLKELLCEMNLFLECDKLKLSYKDKKYQCELPRYEYDILTSKGHTDTIYSEFRQLFKEEFPGEFVCHEPVKKEAEIAPSANTQGAYTPRKNGDYPKRRPKTAPGMIFGVPNKKEPTKIIDVSFGQLCVKAQVINIEKREIKGNKVIVSLLLSDYEETIRAKCFINSDDEFKVNKDMWVKAYGDYTVDEYTGGNVLNLKGIEEEEDPYYREDNCEIGKRVELHLHTKMSTMESTVDIKKAISLASDFSQKAIAITDYGVVQSFPLGYFGNPSKDVKLIYGLEGYVYDDKNLFVMNCDDRPMDEPIVVFDIETTGFDFTREMITELGAVKVVNGKIVEEFQSMVNPLKHIPSKITELTGITDEMVKDAPLVDEVLDKFYEFSKGCALCAHNAKFDTGFIFYFDKKNRFTMPVLDTLAIARKLLPNLKNHKLDTLVKHFKIVLDNHHRAKDDAKATGELLIKLFDIYKKEGLNTLREINSYSNQGEFSQRTDGHNVMILAKDIEGLKNIYEFITKSHLDYFFKKPCIPKTLLTSLREGLLLGASCDNGELINAILNKKSDKELEKIAKYYDYLEIQPPSNITYLIDKGRVKDINELKQINKRIYDLGKKLGKTVVAVGDVHFLEPREEIFFKILRSSVRQGKSKVIDYNLPLYYRTTQEMMEEFSYLGEDIAKEVVIDNTNMIADMCNVDRPFLDGKTYTPSIDQSEEQMSELTYNRAAELYGENLPEIVQKRIDKELGAINKYGYAVLYLIAQKLVKKSMDDGYLVGSRGSVGSSFVAYLSGITEVNPLAPHYICKKCKRVYFDVDKDKYPCGKDLPDKVCDCGENLFKDGYDIPFEVFLGFKGDKVPDIDLNFSGEYQGVAHKYIEELFGKGYVYRAGTVSTLQDKTVYGFVKKYLEEKSISVSNAHVNFMVSGCVGVKRTTGQHPGGIVIVPKTNNVYDFTPLNYPSDDKDKGVITTHFDFNSMHDILVKVDALGHDDPTMLRTLQDATGIDPIEIPLDDKDTMSLFSSKDVLNMKDHKHFKLGTVGVPEFGTKFVRQMLLETMPTTMAELIRISGLSHGTDVWVGNARDLVVSGKCTLRDVICTRDDIMNYLISMGMPEKVSFEVMEMVRKGKGKKVKPEYYEEMRKQKVPEWFIDSCLKIGYMFPKAHASAYVMMAFRIAWYKVHKPLYYYSAHLTRNVDDFDYTLAIGGLEAIEEKIEILEALKSMGVKEKSELSILEIILELKLRGFDLLPVDIYKSKASDFFVEEGKIRMPLRAITGLGDAVANAIVSEREKKDFLSVDDICNRTKLNKTCVAILKEQGCLKDFSDKNQLSLF